MGSLLGSPNNTPPDSELRNIAIPFPALRKPVGNAIAEANQQFRTSQPGKVNEWQYGPNTILPWNDTQNAAYGWGNQTAGNVGRVLDPASNMVSLVSGGGVTAGGVGQQMLDQLAAGNWGATPGADMLSRFGWGEFVGQGPGMEMMTGVGNGQYIGAGPGMGMLNQIGGGQYIGAGPGMDFLRSIGAGNYINTTPGMDRLGDIGGGMYIGNTPGQSDLEDVGSGRYVGKAPGQGTLERFAAGNFARPGAEPLQQILDDALSGGYGIDYLTGTARGDMLGPNPYVDQLIKDQARDINRDYGTGISQLEGRMSGAGRLGSNTEMELQGRGQENLAQELADLETRTRYADYGAERGYQQQAQLALPGARATQIGSQQGIAQARAADEWTALANQLQGAGMAGDAYRSDLGLRLQGAQGAGNLQQNAIGQSIQSLLGAGNLYQNAVGQALSGATAGQQAYQNSIGQALQGATAGQSAYQNSIAQALQGASGAQSAYGNSLAQALQGAGMAGDSARADRGQLSSIAGQSSAAYQNSIAQALQAAGMAPQMAQAQFMGPDAMMRFGTMAQSQGERQAAQEAERFRFQQEQEWNTLQRYLQALQGGHGLTNPAIPGTAASGPGGAEIGAQLLGSLAMAAGTYYGGPAGGMAAGAATNAALSQPQ